MGVLFRIQNACAQVDAARGTGVQPPNLNLRADAFLSCFPPSAASSPPSATARVHRKLKPALRAKILLEDRTFGLSVHLKDVKLYVSDVEAVCWGF